MNSFYCFSPMFMLLLKCKTNENSMGRENNMKQFEIDLYSPTNFREYNLDKNMRYQLSILNRMDKFTKRHSKNVGNLVCRICEYLNCSKEFTVYAAMCGFLHDVGKLAIPPEILNKPGRLTDEEFNIMKTHTTLGYEMLIKDDLMRPYAAGALYHHEALNGTGYPQGLTKKDIPYVAQIIRVADEYDALVTKRQYKTHVNISKTLKGFIKEAQPEEHVTAVALDTVRTNFKFGKTNPKALKALFKVVIDDTFYEINELIDYIEYLNKQINRLQKIKEYDDRMQDSKNEVEKEQYKNKIKKLFDDGENFDNYKQVLSEYKQAVVLKEDIKEKLYNEIKIIKKLKI